METASWVLLIIVSSILAIFLIVAIVATVYVVKILKQVKRITEQAENVVDSVESAAHTFEKAASPLAILKLVGNIVEQASRFGKKKKG
jgi:competence protein ComGC